MPRIAVVGIHGAWSTEILADALASRTGYRKVVQLDELTVDFTSGHVRVGTMRLDELDGLVIKKLSSEYSPLMLQRLYILEYLAAHGVRVFSGPDRIISVVDRLACTQRLRRAQIPMPSTLVTESLEAAIEGVRKFGTAVLKPLYSTKARGMIVLRADQDDLRQQLIDYQSKNPMLYLQKKLSLPGRDYGVTFLGGQYVGTYARVAHSHSWNTTTRGGGHYARAELSPALIEIAARAQAEFGLDYTTVDLAETEEEGPIVFEVSAFGGYRGLVEGCDIDIQTQVADHVVRQLEEGE